VTRDPGQPHTGFAFSGNQGLTLPLDDVNDSLEIYKRFVDDAMIDTIVVETNRRASQLLLTPSMKQIYFIFFHLLYISFKSTVSFQYLFSFFSLDKDILSIFIDTKFKYACTGY